VHRDVPTLKKREIGKILATASKMLRKNSRHNTDDDVACNVTFKLKGPVRTFGSPDAPAIVDKDHIDTVNGVDDDVAGVDFHVKVVREIDFCRPDLPPNEKFDGCGLHPVPKTPS